MGTEVVGRLKNTLEGDASSFNAMLTEGRKSAAQFSAELQKVGANGTKTAEAFTRSLEPSMARINQLTKQFSGAPAAKAANELAIAIDRVGGAGRLTASEQARVNAQVTEAIAKYRVLGLEAPAHLTAIANATKKAATESGGFGIKIGELAGALGLVWGAGAVIAKTREFAGHILDTVSAIGDLSSELGISAEAVQRYGFAARQAGATTEDIGTGIAFMNKALSEGGAGTVLMLRKLGLNIDELRAAGPEKAFEAIVDAIRKIADPMLQAEASVTLFSKSGQKLLPAIKENILEVGKAAAVISNQNVQELKKAKDQWEEFGDTVVVVGAKVLAAMRNLPQAWGTPGGMAGLVNDKFSPGLSDDQKAAIKRNPGRGDREMAQLMLPSNASEPAIAQLTKLVTAYREELKKIPPVGQQAKGTLDALRAAFDADTVAIGKLTQAQRAQIAQLIDGHEPVKDVADAYHLSEAAVQRVVDAQKTAAEAFKQANQPVTEFVKKLHELDEKIQRATTSGQPFEQTIEDLGKEAVDAMEHYQQFGLTLDKVPDRISAIAAAAKDQRLAEIVASANAEMRAAYQKLLESWKAAGDKLTSEQLRQLATGLSGASAIADQFLATFGTATQRQLAAANDWKNKSLRLIEGLAKVAPEKFKRAADQIDRIYAEMTAAGAAFGLKRQMLLQAEAKDLKTAYDAMVASGDYTQAQLVSAWERVKQAEAEAGSVTAQLQLEFEQLGKSIGSILAASFEAGGGFAGAMKSIGTQAGGILGKALGATVSEALGGTFGMVAGSFFGPLGSFLGSLVGDLFNDHGRGTVEDFALGFGGFDKLHAHLQTLGKDGEQLWINLTQKTTDDASARANIQAITDAFQLHAQQVMAVTTARANFDKLAKSGTATAKQLAAAWTKVTEAQTAAGDAATDLADNALYRQTTAFVNQQFGLPDQADLQRTATDLEDAYGVMVRSGKYSTQQLADAWKKVTDAENAAAGITPPTPPDYTALTALAEKYGIAATKLGKTVQQGKLADDTKSLLADFNALFNAVDEDAKGNVFYGFESKFQELYLQAKKLGLALPDTMKPILDRMIAQGDLLDENGNKVADLFGLNFSAPAEDAKQLAANQAALAKSTVDVGEAAAGAVDSFSGKGGLEDALIAAGHGADALIASLGPLGSIAPAGTPPIADTPMMSVTSPGLVRVNPGDWVGMPHLTPAAFGGGGGLSVQLVAWDGKSVDTWLDGGGDVKLARAVNKARRYRGGQ